ncbi:unnamed protein product, partial [Prorocentrum cordatum]
RGTPSAAAPGTGAPGRPWACSWGPGATTRGAFTRSSMRPPEPDSAQHEGGRHGDHLERAREHEARRQRRDARALGRDSRPERGRHAPAGVPAPGEVVGKEREGQELRVGEARGAARGCRGAEGVGGLTGRPRSAASGALALRRLLLLPLLRPLPRHLQVSEEDITGCRPTLLALHLGGRASPTSPSSPTADSSPQRTLRQAATRWPCFHRQAK